MSTAQETIQRAKDRARVRYLASRPGGEGVRPGEALENPNPITLGNKNVPMETLPSPSLSPAQERALASVQGLARIMAVPSEAPDMASALGQGFNQVRAQIVDHGTPKVNAVLCLPEEEQDKVFAGVEAKLMLADIKNLVRALDGQLTLHGDLARAAWADLVKLCAEVGEPEEALTVPVLPVGWDDPTMVYKGVIVKQLSKGKWLFRPHKLSVRPEGILWTKFDRVMVKPGWTVWVTDGRSEDMGGYELWGEYNRYGDRLK